MTGQKIDGRQYRLFGRVQKYGPMQVVKKTRISVENVEIQKQEVVSEPVFSIRKHASLLIIAKSSVLVF